MKLSELLGSLQTFELNLNLRKKEQGITFKAETSEPAQKPNQKKGDGLEESIVLLTKNVRKLAHRFNDHERKIKGKEDKDTVR